MSVEASCCRRRQRVQRSGRVQHWAVISDRRMDGKEKASVSSAPPQLDFRDGLGRTLAS
jgi:hypothetical protein